MRAVSPRRRRWVTVVLLLCVLATVVDGVVVGYGVLWFQLFGETPDASDYAVSAGGYAAAAVVLALAVPALRRAGVPRWAVPATVVCAVALTLLAVSSVVAGRDAEASPAAVDTAWDGVVGVLWAPWTWLLVVLGVRAVVVRHGRAESGVDPGGR